MPEAAGQIAEFIAAKDRLRPTPEQRHLAYRALIDTIAVSVAGRSEPAVRIARDYVAQATGRGLSRSWNDPMQLPAEDAAWLNGISSHVLDYDDVLAPMRGHVSVAVFPALLAIAPEVGATGAQLAGAYIAAFEVIAKLSWPMAASHYARGWHSTSSLGVIGATAGCCQLLGLNQEETVNAIGLAVANASGTRENFGTMAKSFHVGECARTAVRAALLARAGFDASPRALDGPAGFLSLYAEGEDVSAHLSTLGESPLEIERTGIEVKKYPCCYATHLALDGALALRAEFDLALSQIERVEIVASAGALDALIDRSPQSALEAKFSMEYVVAAALQHGAVRLTSFVPPKVLNAEVMNFLPKIAVHEEAETSGPRFATVRLFERNGSRYERYVDHLRGGGRDPLSDSELVEKADDCMRFGGCLVAAKDFAAQVFSSDDQPIANIIAALDFGDAIHKNKGR